MTKYEIHRIYHTVRPKREGPRQGNESIMLANKCCLPLRQLPIYSNLAKSAQTIIVLIFYPFYCYLTRDVGKTMLVLSQ